MATVSLGLRGAVATEVVAGLEPGAELLTQRVEPGKRVRVQQTLLNLPGGVTVIDATVPELFEAERIAQQLGRGMALAAEILHGIDLSLQRGELCAGGWPYRQRRSM